MDRIDKLLIQFEKRSEDNYFEGGAVAQTKTQPEQPPGFNWFPTAMWKSESKAVKRLRVLLMMLILGHITSLVVQMTIFDPNANIVWECMYLWLAYYAFMTCNRIICYLYSLIMFVACGMRAMQVITVMTKYDSIWAPIAFMAQLAFYGFGGYYVFWRMREWGRADPKTDLGGDQKDVEKATPGTEKEKTMEDKVAAETGKHLANGIMNAAEQKSGALLNKIEKKL